MNQAQVNEYDSSNMGASQKKYNEELEPLNFHQSHILKICQIGSYSVWEQNRNLLKLFAITCHHMYKGKKRPPRPVAAKDREQIESQNEPSKQKVLSCADAEEQKNLNEKNQRQGLDEEALQQMQQQQEQFNDWFQFTRGLL